jgi:hypothetical protein
MTYRTLYYNLKNIDIEKNQRVRIPGTETETLTFPFQSKSWELLPGTMGYSCGEHNMPFQEKIAEINADDFSAYPAGLKHHDLDIAENRNFNIRIFKKAAQKRSNRLIFLFHGLNEKQWDKYLPWAEKLVERTGSTVVLFPIAFHMNRIPQDWADSRLMNGVSAIRRHHSPSITNSTFANAAISARLQMIPQRFFWSGLQTFYDVVQFSQNVREGNYEFADPHAGFDFFTFSIGSFLGEILVMSNPNDYFSDSKFFMFCGGPTLDRMSPNSKFILDSDATIAIYSFYTERLESELRLDRRIAHYFGGNHIAGNYFKSMLSYQKEKEFREKRFQELHDRIFALALRKDAVIPPNEVLNTLRGDSRDIPVRVSITDFPYSYQHINPFPIAKEIERDVDEQFDKVFETAAQFFHE